MMEKQLLRITEAANIAGIGRTMAYEFVMAGTWPSVKIGRAIRVPRTGLWAWIETKEQEANQRAEQLRGDSFQ